MGYTRQLGQLAYLITFDGSGNITVPASLTQGSVTSSMLKADAGGKLVAAVAGTDFVAPAGLSAYVPTTRTLTINGTSYDLSADRSWTIVSGVSSFNTRTGAITLQDTDVTGALGYTPVTNARTLTINGTTYDLSANRSWSIVAGISSFNTRTGDITLLDTDVTGALGYTPVTNARTITINGTTYDLSANRTWVVDASSVSTRVIQKFTATSSQTTFTITGGYTVGMVDVFLNGIKLDNATEFTASDGSTVVLALGAATGDIVEVYKYGGQFIANNTLRQSTLFTATAGQTTFTVNYSVGFVDVFYNGSKLDSSEFTATNGTSIVLGTACVLNDKVEVVAYNYTVGAFTGVGGSGTTNYISKWTASGTLNNSLIFDNGTNIGIGTISPAEKLDVIGGAVAAGNGTIRTGITYSSLGLIGTFTNHNLGIITNGSERMRITSSGNIGIGTTTPSSLLEVRGATPFIRITDTSVTGENGLIMDAGGGFIRGALTINYGTGEFKISAGSAGNSYYQTFLVNGSERMRITSSGNVGIGTSSPNSNLGYTSLTINGSTGGQITLRTADTTIGYLYTTSTNFILGSDVSKNLIFDAGANERMRITSSGNVGINQSAPSAKLDINTGAISNNGYDGMRIADDGSHFWFLIRKDSSGNKRFAIYNGQGSTPMTLQEGGGQILTPSQPAFMAYGNGDSFTPLNGSYLWYPTVQFNRGNHYNASNGVFTAPIAGIYYFSWSDIGGDANDVYRFYIRVNNANYLGDYHLRLDTTATGAEYGTNGNRCAMINLAANDTVRIYFRTDSTNTFYAMGATTNPYHNFMGYLIG